MRSGGDLLRLALARSPAERARRGLVFASLVMFIVAVYVAVTVGLGALLGERWDTTLAIAATTTVAMAFAGVRHWAERLAARLVYGDRAPPHQVLSELADRMAGAYATEEVLPEMARTVAAGTGAAEARVWLRRGGELVVAGAWPRPGLSSEGPVSFDGPDLPLLPEADHTAPVFDGGEVIGAITVSQPAGRQLSPVDVQLLADVAAQAGLVLRNVRLTARLAASLEEISLQAEELHASRRRIVAAQDAERRKLERDIHDGAQQHLVALMVYLGLARKLIEREPARAARAVAQLRSVVTGALENLQDLALGIHPPLLREGGLADALAAQSGNPGVVLSVDAVAIGRYAPEAEAAVYFACLEAIQNASKHAPGSHVGVRLVEHDATLSFSVADDGPGFDLERCRRGLGLDNMVDRLAALGGSVDVVSSPGRGTTVLGRLPVSARGPAT